MPPPEVVQRGFPCYFLEDKQVYFWFNQVSGQWQMSNGTDLEKRLQSRGFNPQARGGALSAVQVEKLRIQEECCVKAVASLGWEKVGMVKIGEDNVLVIKGCTLVEPVKGDHNIILHVLRNMLGEEQFKYFIAWCFVAVRGLYQRNHRQYGQAVIFCGKPGCGKSLVQDQLITPMLGGRWGDPYPWISNRTSFNAELFECVHLTSQDASDDMSDYQSRRRLAAALKRITSNNKQTLSRKNFTPYSMDPYWRLTISINDDKDALQALPELTESIEGKVMVFHCHKHPMPLRSDDGTLNRAFAAELPGFLWYLLNEYRMPAEIEDTEGRYGVRAYADPVVRGIMEEDSIEQTLLQHLRAAFGGIEFTEMSAGLMTRLDQSSPPPAIRPLLKHSHHFGAAMTKVMKMEARISKKKTESGAQYTINFK